MMAFAGLLSPSPSACRPCSIALLVPRRPRQSEHPLLIFNNHPISSSLAFSCHSLSRLSNMVSRRRRRRRQLCYIDFPMHARFASSQPFIDALSLPPFRSLPSLWYRVPDTSVCPLAMALSSGALFCAATVGVYSSLRLYYIQRPPPNLDLPVCLHGDTQHRPRQTLVSTA